MQKPACCLAAAPRILGPGTGGPAAELRFVGFGAKFDADDLEEVAAVDAVENVPVPGCIRLILFPPKQRNALRVSLQALLHLLERHGDAARAAERVVLRRRKLLVDFARQARD
jgi:hypothetical protein